MRPVADASYPRILASSHPRVLVARRLPHARRVREAPVRGRRQAAGARGGGGRRDGPHGAAAHPARRADQERVQRVHVGGHQAGGRLEAGAHAPRVRALRVRDAPNVRDAASARNERLMCACVNRLACFRESHAGRPTAYSPQRCDPSNCRAKDEVLEALSKTCGRRRGRYQLPSLSTR